MLVTRLEERALLVENIAVSPDRQASGPGSRALVEAERLAELSRRAEVRLYTNEAIVESLVFYPRRGYRESARRRAHLVTLNRDQAID